MPKGEGTDVRRLFGEDYRSAEPLQKMLRRSTGYRGKGAYWGKALGGWAGGRISALTGFDQFKDWGAKAGDWASDKAQDFAMNKLKKLTGQGLYGGQGAYLNNALIAGGAQSMDIKGNTDETETITIRNCESMFEIFAPTIASGSSPFASQKVAINPGLFDFSRKLSAIAKNYLQYEIKQMVFEIRPLVGESTINNGISGNIMAAVSYDPVPEVPDNKDEFMDMSGAVSGRIIDQLNVGVECDPTKTKSTEYFVRTGPVALGRDVDEFDHCALYIGTNNIPSTFSNIAIAELWVYYTIELRMWKPNRDILRDLVVSNTNRTQLRTGLGTEGNPYVYSYSGVTDINQNLVGFAQQSNLGCKYTGFTPSILGASWEAEFPANFSGCVEVHLRYEGVSLGGQGSIAITTTGNVSPIKDMYASTDNQGGNADSPGYTFVNGGLNLTTIIMRLRVRSATGAQNNAWRILIAGITGTITQWSLETTEYSTQLMQKGLVDPRPKFVDTSGREITLIES